MITPKEFTVDDFIDPKHPERTAAYNSLQEYELVRAYNAIRVEALTGSDLIDNLILLRFCELPKIQALLRDKYNMMFYWLKTDPTPPEYREIADRHGILIERGRSMIVYIPIGATVDDVQLQIDIPQYQLVIRYVADCNIRMLKTGISITTLSPKLAEFRPILVFKRLIMDCMVLPATDLHFVCWFEEKAPTSHIEYRYKREIVKSPFNIDFEMMTQIIQAVIGKLTPTSVMDVDSMHGVVTSVRNLFGDATTDLRIASSRVDAGFYTVFTIQNTNTTTRIVDQLGFPKQDVAIIRQLAKRRTGLTLVTGEMRSGKNTTIFAMLNELVHEPIRIIEYSNPIENHMPFPQIDYQGDLERLKSQMRLAKKQDIDIAVLNEIPDADVAFAVRDLVNSSIGVITTTHINRVWNLPNKLREFFGNDYKTIISQLNVCINHKMFRRWSGKNMQKRTLVKEQGEFEMFCYNAGVRQYFVPEDSSKVRMELQPLTEIMVFTDAIKTAMLNFDELWRAEQMIESQMRQGHATLENKVAEYVNAGLMSLQEMRHLY